MELVRGASRLFHEAVKTLGLLLCQRTQKPALFVKYSEKQTALAGTHANRS